MVSRKFVFVAAFSLGAFVGIAVADTETFPQAAVPADADVAFFAGGCPACVEADFDMMPGVLITVTGMIGSEPAREAVKIVFDPRRVGYGTLVDTFFRSVDPLDAGGQFCERGAAFGTAVFVDGPQQRAAAEAAKAAADAALGRRTVTPIVEAALFTPAADEAQDEHLRNRIGYALARWRCGRDRGIEAVWGERGG